MLLRRSKHTLTISLLAICLVAATPFALTLQDDDPPPDPEILGDLNTEGSGEDEDSEEVNNGSYPKHFVAAGNSLYMSATIDKKGTQLFAYMPDGKGIELVTVAESNGSEGLIHPESVAVVDEWGFFTARTAENKDPELWRVHHRQAVKISTSSGASISGEDVVYAEMGSYLLFFQGSENGWKIGTVHGYSREVRDLKSSTGQSPVILDLEPVILGSGGDFVVFKTVMKIPGGNDIETMYVCNHREVKEIPFDMLPGFSGSFVKYDNTLVFCGDNEFGAEPWIFVQH